MKFNSLSCLLFSLFTLISLTTFSQEEEIIYDDTISVTEWLDGMEAFKPENEWSTYKLTNTWIKLYETGADSNLINVTYEQFIKDSITLTLEVIKYHYPILILEKNYRFIKCKFSGFSELRNLSIRSLSFDECTFDTWDSFTLIDCEFGSLDFRNCKNSISIRNSICTTDIIFRENQFESVKLDSIVFNSVEANYFPGSYPLNLIRVVDENDYEFKITNCTFHPSKQFGTGSFYKPISITNSNFETLELINLDVFSINFENTTVSKSMVFDSVNISDFILTKNFDFPLNNTNMSWEEIGGNKLSYSTPHQQNYRDTYSSHLSNSFHYDELLSIYQKMLNLYKERGDRKSFNGCYVEMRDLETDRLHYEYTQDKTMHNLFNWRMNQFLKTFCAFGTNPVTAYNIHVGHYWFWGDVLFFL